MPEPPFKKILPETKRLSAEAFNRLQRLGEASSRLSCGPGLRIGSGLRGQTVAMVGAKDIWIKITGAPTGSAYPWVQVMDETGTTYGSGNGGSGTATLYPAKEINGVTTVANGTIALAKLAPDGQHYLFSLQVGSAGAGRLLARQIFTSSLTYTPTAGANTAYVQVLAAGGGGGGANSGHNTTCAGAGCGGNYSESLISGPVSTSITVGTGGTGGTNVGGAGNPGGNSSFGSLVKANGGGGGAGDAGGAATPYVILGGFQGNSGTPFSGQVGDIQILGGPGAPGIVLNSTTGVQSNGGDGAGPYGGGGVGGRNNGAVFVGQWGGGGCGGSSSGASGSAGVNGANGIVVVWDYS